MMQVNFELGYSTRGAQFMSGFEPSECWGVWDVSCHPQTGGAGKARTVGLQMKK